MLAIYKSRNTVTNKVSFLISIDAQLYFKDVRKATLGKFLCEEIVRQTIDVFNFSESDFSVQLNFTIEQVYSEVRVSRNKLLFLVMPVNNNNPAEADFKGLCIKINLNAIDTILQRLNTRTIPHELGHVFGLEHPHANGVYESVNPQADKLYEQSLTEEERRSNLMCQTWYIQKTGKPIQNAVKLTRGQLELMHLNYVRGKLFNNYHLKGFWIFKQLLY